MRNSLNLLANAWDHFFNNLTIYLGITGVAVLLPTVLMVLLHIDPAVYETNENLTTPEFLTIFFSAVVSIIASAGFIFVAAGREESHNPRTLLKASFMILPSYIWISILQVSTTLLGLIFLIIPGIYLAVVFSTATMVLVSEGVRGRKALIQSYRYVKGRWFQVFLRCLFLFIVGLVLSMIIGLFTSFVLGGDVYLQSIVASVVMNGFSMLLGALSTVYIYLLYTDLKNTYIPPQTTGVPAPGVQN